jgi:hypothetical protein
MDWLESLVERRIREAAGRGEFDDLPGAGRPLDLRDADDPDWWLKRYVRREGIDLAAALPAPLALRREAEEFPGSLVDLTTADQVRAVLADFNDRVEAEWRRPVIGSGFPMQAYQVDVEALVERWQAARDAASWRSEPAEPSDPSEPAAGGGRRRRLSWFGRGRPGAKGTDGAPAV